MSQNADFYDENDLALSPAYAKIDKSRVAGYEVHSDVSTLGSVSGKALQLITRSLDILLSLVAFVVLLPLMVAVFFAIRFERKGTAFVLHTVRSPAKGRVAVLKFRTRQALGSRQLTRVGTILKAYDLDRLPYLYAIAKGDLSFFGRSSVLVRPRDQFEISQAELSFNGYAELLKYPMDVLFVLLASPMILIVVGVLYVIVRSDGGPGFFGQLRVGRNGKEFRCWKIRTMQINAAEMLKEHLENDPEAAKEWEETRKLANDPRITKIGKILRKTSLDEFPQFWNVIKGEMSLVGPRPVPRDELRKYGKSDLYYKAVRPGVTGLWQVSGRNDISYDERVALDINYTQSLNIKGDIMIIFKTVGAMLNRTGG